MQRKDTHVELHDTHTKIKKLMDEIRNLYNIYILAAKPKAAEARSSKPEAKSQKKPKARSKIPEVRSQKPKARSQSQQKKKAPKKKPPYGNPHTWVVAMTASSMGSPYNLYKSLWKWMTIPQYDPRISNMDIQSKFSPCKYDHCTLGIMISVAGWNSKSETNCGWLHS